MRHRAVRQRWLTSGHPVAQSSPATRVPIGGAIKINSNASMLPDDTKPRLHALSNASWSPLALGSSGALGLATIAILFAMGRSAWCRCGTLRLSSWDIWSSHNSQHLLDPYFFSHLLHGILFCGFLYWLPRIVAPGWKFVLAVACECSWEILENSPLIIDRYRTATIALNYYGDSVANSICDLLACMLGYGIGLLLGLRKSVALVVTIELLMVVTIRDCLTLNIVMLVYPLEAIKQWQVGG